jgi:hypothetical protein
MKCITDFFQRAYKLVRGYANRIKANCLAVGRLLQEDMNHYKVAWNGLPPELQSKIKPWTQKNSKFHCTKARFDRTTDSDVKPDDKTSNSSSSVNR